MRPKYEIIHALRTKLRLRHYALSTEESYCGWIARYYDFCVGVPKEWPSERKAEAFLSDVAVRQRVSARTQNQALSAVLFLYREIFDRELHEIDALRARQPMHERTAPSRDQVRLLRKHVRDRPGAPMKLLVDLLYGCGLRVTEPHDLRIKDILWSERQLVVRAGKGAKDRRVPVPEQCLEPLRTQIDLARQIWESDGRLDPRIGVTLPHQLAKKYPSAAYAWQLFWVFPASSHCRDPRSGAIVRYHLLHDQIQRAVREAALKIGLDGFITPHVLRHAYATHSREQIETLRQLMGHVSIETTAGYRHPLVEQATNPLDDLLSG